MSPAELAADALITLLACLSLAVLTDSAVRWWDAFRQLFQGIAHD